MSKTYRKKVLIRTSVDEGQAWKLSDEKAKEYGLSPTAKNEVSCMWINIHGQNVYESYYYEARNGSIIGYLTVVVISSLQKEIKDQASRLLTINND